MHTRILQQLRQVLFPPVPDAARSLSTLSSTITYPTISRGGHTIIAPLPYEHRLVRTTVQALKFRGDVHAAGLLAAILAPLLAEELADRRLTGTFERALLIPMPLHPTRIRERGFNQCVRIATPLITALGEMPPILDPTVLMRTRHTPQQSHIRGVTARCDNVRDAFLVSAPQRIATQDVILLDDVITTGATMLEATKVLHDAGAHNVLCVAAARA